MKRYSLLFLVVILLAGLCFGYSQVSAQPSGGPIQSGGSNQGGGGQNAPGGSMGDGGGPTEVGGDEDQGGGGGPDPSALDLSGYAWSPNIGWISFSSSGMDEGPAYGVTAEYMTRFGPPDGVSWGHFLSGYAWSPNIGWIRFNPDIDQLLANGESAPPGNDPWGAFFDVYNERFSGWARACVVFAEGCGNDNNLLPDSQRGGWDGWIKFAGSVDGGGSYNLEVDNGYSATRFIDDRYAWGGNVVGWISFCDQDGVTPYCVYLGRLKAMCNFSPPKGPDGSINIGSTSGTVTWLGSASGGYPPYTLEWSGEVTGSASGYYHPTNVLSVAKTFNNPDDLGLKTALLEVTDYGGDTSQCLGNVMITGASAPSDSGEAATGDLTDPVPNTIRIVSQPLTSPAISSETTFYNQATGGEDALPVSVISTRSLVDSSKNLSNVAPAGVVGCHFAETAVSSDSNFVDCGSASMSLLPDHGNDAHFNVRVTKAVLELNTFSPYEIIVSASSSCPAHPLPGDPCQSLVKSFIFNYSAGVIRPL